MLWGFLFTWRFCFWEISGLKVWAEGPANLFVLLWPGWNPDPVGRQVGRNIILEPTNPILPGTGVCWSPIGNNVSSPRLESWREELVSAKDTWLEPAETPWLLVNTF